MGIPAAVAIVFAGGWVLTGALALLAAGGSLELDRLARRSGIVPFTTVGVAAAGALVLIAGVRPTIAGSAPTLWVAAIALILGVSASAIWLRGTRGRPLEAAAVTTFIALFLGGALGHGVFLRYLPASLAGVDGVATRDAWAGTAIVVFVIGLTWINDSSAYFAGRAWGRRRLIPDVSPGKTVVGAIAGVVAAVAVGAVYAAVVLGGWLKLPIGAPGGAVGGVLIAIAAQVGDLVESLFKREAGVKDSGQLIPGHGGILDRFDALFFTLPVAYWYLAVVLARGSGVLTWP